MNDDHRLLGPDRKRQQSTAAAAPTIDNNVFPCNFKLFIAALWANAHDFRTAPTVPSAELVLIAHDASSFGSPCENKFDLFETQDTAFQSKKHH